MARIWRATKGFACDGGTPPLREGARPARRCSPADRALHADVERIERVARRHEEMIAPQAAEADVGGPLGQRDRADLLALRTEYNDAVESVAEAPSAPQIAVDVAAEAVGRFCGITRDERLAAGQLGTVADH